MSGDREFGEKISNFIEKSQTQHGSYRMVYCKMCLEFPFCDQFVTMEHRCRAVLYQLMRDNLLFRVFI